MNRDDPKIAELKRLGYRMPRSNPVDTSKLTHEEIKARRKAERDRKRDQRRKARR